MPKRKGTYARRRTGTKKTKTLFDYGIPSLPARRRSAYKRAMTTAVRQILNGRTGGFVGLERKFFDSAQIAAIAAPNNAAGGEVDPTTLACLNCPAQGDSENQRDGRQIAMDSINIRGVVTLAAQTDQTAGDVLPSIIIALVLDKQTNAAQLNSEDVFENPSASAALAANPFRNLEYTGRFRVLRTVEVTAADFAGSIQPVYDGTNIEQQGASVAFSMYVPLKGMKVNFLSGQTTSVIGAIADNSLHMIAYCNSTSMAPTINYNARLRFKG